MTPQKMYENCGNSLWLAEVQHLGEYETSWALTLLADGKLLLQTFWIMDGAPMVSYQWFERIS